MNAKNRGTDPSSLPLMTMQGSDHLANGTGSPVASDHDWSDQELEEFSRDPLESVLMQMRLWPQTITRQQCVRAAVFSSAISLCIGFVSAFIILLLAYPPSTCIKHFEEDRSLYGKLVNQLDPELIKAHLRKLSRNPHIAGSPEDKTLMEYIAQEWKTQGLDEVNVVPYNVTFKYPDASRPNEVSILRDGKVIVTINETPPAINITMFHPFSADGNVEGQLIYVNFGTVEDYTWLRKNNYLLEGKILFARYGRIPLTTKVHLADMVKATGIILYPDPEEFAPLGTDEVYPKTKWLPGNGVLGGEVWSPFGDFHDILGLSDSGEETSTKDAEAQLESLHNYNKPINVIVSSISYDDAHTIFRSMDGIEAPKEWSGKLNVTYKLQFSASAKTQVKLSKGSKSVPVTLHNVIGQIKGAVEPDRYVIIGSHRDSTGFGAINPSSGTAVILELSRVFSMLKKGGWKPRRSILFCNWAAGEYGSTGVIRWTEEYSNLLRERAVVYINAEQAVRGSGALRAASVPSLKQLLFTSSKKVPNPNLENSNEDGLTVYDVWVSKNPENATLSSKEKVPKVHYPGQNGAYGSFLFSNGVPVLDVSYDSYEDNKEIEDFPLQHTQYDTFHSIDSIVDESSEYHLTIAELWAEIIRALCDSEILPFDVLEIAKEINGTLVDLHSRHRNLLDSNSIKFGKITAAAEDFVNIAFAFHKMIKQLGTKNPLTIRSLNDQLMQVERAFISPRGLSCEPSIRHAVLSPSPYSVSKGEQFLCLKNYLKNLTGKENKFVTGRIEEEISVIAETLQLASKVLKPSI